MPAIGFWKMFDNLRRTLSAPAAVLSLIVGWTLPLPAALVWTGFVLLAIALPTILPVIAALFPRHAKITTRSHFDALRADVVSAASQTALLVVFLAHHAWLMADAIGRTLFRLVVSHRRLLEWITAAQSKQNSGLAGAASTARWLEASLSRSSLLAWSGWWTPRRSRSRPPSCWPGFSRRRSPIG